LTLPAPAGGVVSGQFVVIAALAGVCQYDAAAGAPVEVALVGVWSLPKAAGIAIAAGAAVNWDAANSVVTTAAGTAIGAAAAAAADSAATVTVRLNGVAIAA
jgi:predicted RecA/RadA family phage recombinase